jgi:predicted ATPase
MLGFPNQALKHMAESVALARNTSFPHALAFALIYSAQLHRFLLDPSAVAGRSEEAQQIAAHEGFSLLEAQASFERGWCFIYQQRIEEGLATMHRAVEALEGTGAVASPWRSAPLAEAYEKNGYPAKGLEILTHAVAEAGKTGERFYEAELLRLMGELILAVDTSNSAKAEHEFMRAIEVARLQGARSLELRSRTSLARLLQKQDKRDEARAMLAEIYGWFTEGLDTADLKEARGLLNELSS